MDALHLEDDAFKQYCDVNAKNKIINFSLFLHFEMQIMYIDGLEQEKNCSNFLFRLF